MGLLRKTREERLVEKRLREQLRREKKQQRLKSVMRDSFNKSFLGSRTLMPVLSKRLTRVSFFGMRDQELSRASCVTARDSAFHRYFLRLLHNSVDVAQPFANLIQSACKKSLARLKELPSHANTDADALAASVLKHARFSDGRMYALFSDLVRLLYDTQSALLPLSESTIAPRAAHEFLTAIVLQSPEDFEILRESVAGDPARAAIAALRLITCNDDSHCISDALSELIMKSMTNDESGAEGNTPQQSGTSPQSGTLPNYTKWMLQIAAAELSDDVGDAASLSTEIRDYANDVLGNCTSDAGSKAGTESGIHVHDINQAAESFHFFKAVVRKYSTPRLSSAHINQIACDKAVIEAIFAFMGRMSNVIGEASMKSRHGDGEIVDVTTGSVLRDLLPVEMPKMAIPVYKPLFASQFAEQTLLINERTHLDDSGDGPIIFLIDFSASMSNANMLLNNKTSEFVSASSMPYRAQQSSAYTTLNLFQTASAFALALARYAAYWSRDVIIVPADTRARVNSVVFISQRLRNTQDLTNQLRRMLALQPSGGTAFCRPIHETLNNILPIYQAQGADFRQADIVYVTDGEGDVNFYKGVGEENTFGYNTSYVSHEECFSRFARQCFPDGLPKGVLDNPDNDAMLRFLEYAKTNPQRAARMRNQFRASAIAAHLKNDCDFDLSLCRMFALFVGDTPNESDCDYLPRKMNDMLFDFTIDCDFNNLEKGVEQLMKQLIAYSFYHEDVSAL